MKYVAGDNSAQLPPSIAISLLHQLSSSILEEASEEAKLLSLKSNSNSRGQEMGNEEVKPAVDASRSVDTGVMAAPVLNGALVDVLALQGLFVQSGRGQDFFAHADISQPPALLARTFKGAG